MGMGMGDAGRMMGMTAERHQEMIDSMEALRGDVQPLRVAAPAEVMERMPRHLDRLEDMALMMEQGAAHMQSMGGMGGTSYGARAGHDRGASTAKAADF